MIFKKVSRQGKKEYIKIHRNAQKRYSSYLFCGRNKNLTDCDDEGNPFNIISDSKEESFEELLTLLATAAERVLWKAGKYQNEISDNYHKGNKALTRSNAMLSDWLDYWHKPEENNDKQEDL